jgi:hypothetical protein
VTEKIMTEGSGKPVSVRNEGDWPLVAVAIMQVKRNLTAVGKDGYNQTQKFPYRALDDVVNMLHPLCADAGLITIPEVLSYDASTYETKHGATWNMVRVRTQYTLMAEDGSKVIGVGAGEGSDPGDKALNKAQANALKYFLCQLFQIPTGDTESDSEANGQGETGRAPTERMPARPRNSSVERRTNAPTKRENLSEENNAWNTPRPVQDVPLTGGQFADEASIDPPQDPPGPPGGALGRLDLAKLAVQVAAVAETEAGLETLRGFHRDIGQAVASGAADVPSGNEALALVKRKADMITAKLKATADVAQDRPRRGGRSARS